MSLIGIDLGTTFCAVATLDDRGRPVTVPNRDGEVLTPSAVYLAPDGSAVVGAPALDLAPEQPDRVATLVKRRMGYADVGRPVAGRTFRPETLSAVLLRKLAQDAAAALGAPVSQCVITVPAYFDDTRRKATMDAGRIAGLEVIDILDEPSAAALAYALQQPDATLAAAPRTVLVYDLGGGTFDVTLVKLAKKKFQVLAIEGDVRLGGKDWDDRLVNRLADQFKKQFGADPRADDQSLALLQAAAERAKRTLSEVDQTTVTVAHGGHTLAVPVTRVEFEKLTQDLLVRTRLTTQQVLNQAGLAWDKVDRVLMVGGSTHMPMAGRMLADVTGKEPDRSLAVSEVVARGAAAHAGIVRQREEQIRASGAPALELLAGVVEISVNAHSLGVEARKDEQKVNSKLIVKNTQLPAAVSRVYYTTKPGQEKVRVRIVQGEAQQAEACIPVGECWIEGLPGDLPRGSPVQVRCGVAANGRIEVMALDMTSGRLATAEIHRPGGLTDAEIAKEAAWVRGLNIR
ncbi:MAG: Hsp70 family protein [Gemmataceae bacterium]|nr:Hsp70 family protein [Gemmataceae bacterium]